MTPTIDYDDQAGAYARNRQVHPGVLAELLDHGGLNRPSRVLEVGCGTGNYIGAIQDRVGCPCWGMDPSTGMLSQAGAKFPEVRFSKGEAGRLHFGSDFFDFVFSVDVIHHVPDPLAYFKEACVALKAGGTICTATDDEDIIRHRRLLSRYFPTTVEKELERYPSLATLEANLREVGFCQIETRHVASDFVLDSITPYEERSFSALRLIPDDEFQQGLGRLRRDLEVEPIRAVLHYVMLWAVKA